MVKEYEDRRRRWRSARGAGVLMTCWREASDRMTIWSPMMPPFGKTSLILVMLICFMGALRFWRGVSHRWQSGGDPRSLMTQVLPWTQSHHDCILMSCSSGALRFWMMATGSDESRKPEGAG